MPSTNSTQMPRQPEPVNTPAAPSPAPAGEATPVQYVTPAAPMQQPVQPVTVVQPVAPALPPLPPRVLPVPAAVVTPATTETPGAPVQYVIPVADAPAAAVRAFNVRRVVYTVLSILETFLTIRLLLRLLAANPDAAFSRLIYALTFPFITPFAGVFPDSGASGSVLELSTILAMIMYPLFCWIIVRVVRLTNHRRGATPTTN